MLSPADPPSDATLEARAPRLRDGRLHPILAWRSLRRLIANPDDTARVFEIIDALSGNNDQTNFVRFRGTETGRTAGHDRHPARELLHRAQPTIVRPPLIDNT